MPWSKQAGALAGALAALAGLTVAELLALVVPTQPSVVAGLANLVINVTPASIREALISRVGTADKPLLQLGIVIAFVAMGALIGLRLRNRAERSAPVFAVVGVITAALMVAAAPLSITPIVMAFVTALAGAATACLVFKRLMAQRTDETADESRRVLLIGGLVIGGAAAASTALIGFTRHASVQTVERVREALKLAEPVKTAPPVPAGAAVDVAGMPGPVTPNAEFYKIDTTLTPPAVELDGWTLSITGLVDHPLTFTYDELAAMPQIEKWVTLTCVSNEVGGDLVGNALWQGIPLVTLLEQAGVQKGADQLVGESVDGFTAGFPLQLAFDGREPLLALGMNGEPLPIDHGFPARLVVPGLYGYVSATKWLSEVRITTLAAETPFWVQRGWIADGTIIAASRIDVPKNRAQLKAGTTEIAGRAWHQQVAIGAVEVSIDKGPWRKATLADSMGIDTWRLWSLKWDATGGDHTLEVRMIDADGNVQTGAIENPGPGPSSGYQQIRVTAG